MAFLIDGNNLIGQTPSLSVKDPKSRQRLIFRLLIFQKIKNTRVILVFDGHPDLSLPADMFQGVPFSVHYPAFEEDADTVIKDIISKQTDLRQFHVVSSDRDLQTYARSQGAKSLNCDDFNRMLKQTIREHKKLAELEKNVSLPSPLEIKHWIEIFNTKK